MKRMIIPVYAGISGKYNKQKGKFDFTVDFESNSSDDVIKFIEPYFQQSNIDENVYWFGYSFNDDQSTDRRDQFIEFIKHVQPERLSDPEDEWSGFDYNDDNLTETDLKFMIGRSLDRIKLGRYSIDTIVYPQSNSGNLVKMIARIIAQYTRSASEISMEELTKADPEAINFDFVQFYKDLGDRKIDVPDYVDDDYIERMLYKARTAPYFSLRKYIKPAVLRNYVSNFYNANKSVSNLANSEVVLVVDDFGTTGTTIRELIRNIREINSYCEVYIFTLMGKKQKA